MARYHDVPDHMKITSEMIEPTFGIILGRLWAQAQYMKQTAGIDSWAYADALENMWYALDHMQSLSSLCIDTKHAVIALSNHAMTLAGMINKEIGINPISDKDCFPFRHNTNISEEAVAVDEVLREERKNTPFTAEELDLIAKSIAFMNSFNLPDTKQKV